MADRKGDRGRHQARKRAVDLLFEAEARWLAGKRPSQRQLFAVLDDTGHLDRRALCAAAAADVCGDASAEARLTVPTLLERAWPSVIIVAQTIHRAGEATHDDVLTALGITDGGGPASHALAMIRAGGSPGSFTVIPAAV